MTRLFWISCRLIPPLGPNIWWPNNEPFEATRTKAVRHFIPIMENYDMELDCNDKLTTQDALNIVKRCSNPKALQYPLLLYISDLYMKHSALLKKTKPAGWICA